MNTSENDKKYLLSSLDNALDILNELSKTTDMGVTELSNKLSMGKSSVFRSLYTMERKGFVKKVGESRYALGMRLTILGNIANNSSDEFQPLHYILQNVVEKTNVTVYLSTLNDNNEMLFMDCATGSSIMQFRAKIGSRYPAYCSGGGKLLLAHTLGTPKEDNLKNINFIRRTPTTICTYNELIEELKHILKRGYSIDNGEGESEVLCFGFPVYDTDGSFLCSFSISGSRTIMMAHQEEYLGYMRDALKELSNFTPQLRKLIKYYNGTGYFDEI